MPTLPGGEEADDGPLGAGGARDSHAEGAVAERRHLLAVEDGLEVEGGEAVTAVPVGLAPLGHHELLLDDPAFKDGILLNWSQINMRI